MSNDVSIGSIFFMGLSVYFTAHLPCLDDALVDGRSGGGSVWVPVVTILIHVLTPVLKIVQWGSSQVLIHDID